MAAKTLSNLGVLFTDRRDFYLSPRMTKELWTDVAPFLTIISSRGSVTGLADPVFKMFEHRNPWQKQQFQSNVGASPVTVPANGNESGNIAIDNIVGLAPSVDASYRGLEVEIWDSNFSTKKGVALITSAVNATTIKLKHLFSPSGGDISVADNDNLLVVGNAHGEGQVSPEAWADELQVVYNSTQIFRVPVEITGTLYQAALRGYSNELARLRLQKAQEAKIQRERAFLFGGSVLGTGMDGATFADSYRTDTDGKAVRTTMGLIPAIEKYGFSSGDNQNIFTISEANYKFSNFVDDMEKVFQYVPESGEKIALCGRGALSYFSKVEATSGFVGKSGWQIQLSTTQRDSLGFNFRRLETPHGVLKLVPAPVLRGPYNKYMVVISEENLDHVVYRPAVYSTNIKTDNKYDGIKDEYFFDEGIGITLIESHKLFKIVA